MRSKWNSLLTLTTILAFAAPVWAAVVVKVEVKNSAGEPVPGATVKIGDLETTTDESGAAQLDVQVESGAEIEAVVTYRDRRTGQEILARRTFRAVEGAQISIGLPQLGQLPRRSGIPMLGGMIGGTFGRQAINDTGLSGSRFTDVIEVGTPSPPGSTPGSSGGGTTTLRNENRAKTPEEIAESNRIERKNHRFGPDGGAVVAIPLAGPAGWGGRRNASMGWQNGTPAAQTRSAGTSSGGWRVHPSASIGLSRTSVDFESLDLETPANSQRFSGSGTLFTVGANAVIVPCAGCAWYLDAGYQLARTGAVDMRRTSNIADLVGPDVQVVQDGGEYRYTAHTVRTVVARGFRQVAPFGGIRLTRWSARLDLASELDFAPALGFPATQRFTAANDYDATLLEVIGGIDIRFPRTPLFLRVQGASDGTSHSFGVGFGVAVGR